jgi:hypothetical protein
MTPFRPDPDSGDIHLAPLDLRPCCRNLRHKMMYCDERQATPGLVDTRSDSRVYFCILTCQPLGPDDRPVEPGACASPGRACFRPGAGAAPGGGAGTPLSSWT